MYSREVVVDMRLDQAVDKPAVDSYVVVDTQELGWVGLGVEGIEELLIINNILIVLYRQPNKIIA